MAPVLQLLGLSAAASILLQRIAPSYPLGIISSSVALFTLQFLVLQAWNIILYPRYFSPIRDIPTPSGADFFLGHTKKILREPSGRPAREWAETIPNDGLIRYSTWFQERVLITTPKALGEVLVTKNYDFEKPYTLRNGLGRLLGIGILLAEGDEHKTQRKNLMPAFAYRHIKDLVPLFWSKSREMVDCVVKASQSTTPPSELDGAVKDPNATKVDVPEHAPGIINVGMWTSRATLDIIGASAMGQDFGSLQDPNNKLALTYRSVFDLDRGSRILQIISVFVPFAILSRLPIKRNAEIVEASAYIKQVCRDLIAKKRASMAEKERTEVDLVSVALESGGFSDEDLVNQMMTFLVAGHETTATAMIWALYVLCKHPEVQRRLRDEVRAKLPSLDQDITAADLDNCHYLRAVCSETLRLWSPVTLTLRVAARDTSINGHFIPKGTIIILAPMAVNTSSHQWGKDAFEFNPDRWLDADGKANNKGGADSNFSFLTFLHGPRSCIGQRFAQAEFECLLAAWVGRLDTAFEEGSPLEKAEPEIQGGITSKPKGGLWVQAKELQGW